MARKMLKKNQQHKRSAKNIKTHLQSTPPLKDTLSLIETDLEVKSFIYQQINEFAPYTTEDTNVIVLARDPEDAYSNEDHMIAHDYDSLEDHYAYRIAIVLKEAEATIEAEGFGYDVYDAITAAKEAMLARLSELAEEVESPQDRLKAIQLACENNQIH